MPPPVDLLSGNQKGTVDLRYVQLFFGSLTKPKVLAACRMLPLGTVMKYLFFFIALISAGSFIRMALGIGSPSSTVGAMLREQQGLRWLLYPAALSLIALIQTIDSFVRTGILALFGLACLRLSNRKGELRHTWRSSVFASTISFCISLAALPFPSAPAWVGFASFGASAFYLWLACLSYPKQAPPRAIS